MSVTAISEDARAGPGSLVRHVYDELCDRLTMLDVRPGAPLNEVVLAAEFAVGRTPVREALKLLETDHLVISYPRRGTFATQVDITELSAVSELRRNLEPMAARKAALSAPHDMRVQLRVLVNRLEDLAESSPTKRELIRADLDAHRLLYKAAGNRHLEETLVRMDNLATRIWCLVLDRVPLVSGHIQEHVALLEAVISGRDEAAGKLALGHVADFEQTMRTVL